MTTKAPSVFLIVGTMLVVTVGLRALLAWAGDFGPADLERYEAITGIDLPDVYERMPFFLTWTRGDGQVYMTLAADPFLDGPSRTLGSSVYRFGRAGFAWAGRIASFGHQSLLPVGLLAVNLIALAAYTVLVVRAGVHHPKALWLLANPAVLFGVAADTAEPFGLALVMLVITSGSWIAAVTAGALGLVRESYGTVIAIARHPVVALASASASAIAMRLLAVSILGGSPFAGLSHLTWPLKGYLDGLPLLEWPSAVLALVILVAMGATFVRGFVVAGVWRRLSWWSAGLLGLCLSTRVTTDLVNIVRALGAVPVLWAMETHTTTTPGWPNIAADDDGVADEHQL